MQDRAATRSITRAALAAILLACVMAVRCGGGSPPAPTPTPPISTPPGDPNPTPNPNPTPTPSAPVTFSGVGDIAWCNDLKGTRETAKLMENIGGTFFTLGDNVYDHGTAAEFNNCYEPTWGKFKTYTRPVPGNHEYEAGANPNNYFDYFGSAAGPRGDGFYSYDLGEWHIIALNSNIPMTPNSAQGRFLDADVKSHLAYKCTLAYWHHPVFTSGQNGRQMQMFEAWKYLHANNAEVVLSGHDHLYERFLPQDPDGRPDPARGMTQFVVGTGGADLYVFNTLMPNSDKRVRAFGILKMTLRSGGYDWQFIQPGNVIGDSGSAVCH